MGVCHLLGIIPVWGVPLVWLCYCALFQVSCGWFDWLSPSAPCPVLHVLCCLFVCGVIATVLVLSVWACLSCLPALRVAVYDWSWGVT